MTALALVTGATPLMVESALFEEMLGGRRRQQLSRRLGASLIDGRERTVRRFQAFSGDWPWVWRAEDLERLVAASSWAHSTVRAYQGGVAAFCAYVTDPRYGWVAVRARRSHRGIGSPATSPWLFPGDLPGRPITASRLGERLRLLGIRALPARRATLVQLAAEVPAAVLAELLNLTPATATRWTRDAGGDWSGYAAELARRHDHPP